MRKAQNDLSLLYICTEASQIPAVGWAGFCNAELLKTNHFSVSWYICPVYFTGDRDTHVELFGQPLSLQRYQSIRVNIYSEME